MDETSLGIASGIAQGIESAVTNIYNINMARQQLERQKKADDINFKIKDLEIKKLETSLDPEQIDIERKKLKLEMQAKKAAYDLYTVKARQTEKRIEQDLEKQNTLAVMLGLKRPENVLSSSRLSEYPIEMTGVRKGGSDTGTRIRGSGYGSLDSPYSSEQIAEDMMQKSGLTQDDAIRSYFNLGKKPVGSSQASSYEEIYGSGQEEQSGQPGGVYTAEEQRIIDANVEAYAKQGRSRDEVIRALVNKGVIKAK